MGPYHYFKLAPSKIPNAGIGVFSLQDIPDKTSLLDLFDFDEPVQLLDPMTVPVELRDHGVKQPDGRYSYASNLNRMSVGWYLNHSLDPNITSVNNEDTEFITIRDIKAGEELTIDYRTLEPDFTGY